MPGKTLGLPQQAVGLPPCVRELRHVHARLLYKECTTAGGGGLLDRDYDGKRRGDRRGGRLRRDMERERERELEDAAGHFSSRFQSLEEVLGQVRPWRPVHTAPGGQGCLYVDSIRGMCWREARVTNSLLRLRTASCRLLLGTPACHGQQLEQVLGETPRTCRFRVGCPQGSELSRLAQLGTARSATSRAELLASGAVEVPANVRKC